MGFYDQDFNDPQHDQYNDTDIQRPYEQRSPYWKWQSFKINLGCGTHGQTTSSYRSKLKQYFNEYVWATTSDVGTRGRKRIFQKMVLTDRTSTNTKTSIIYNNAL